MTDRLTPPAEAIDWRDTVSYVAAFFGLALFYWVTAPTNHTLSVDSDLFAWLISSEPINEVERPRMFLWLVGMKIAYMANGLVSVDPDPYALAQAVNSVISALAVVLFARLLIRHFSVDPISAALGAGMMAFTYGIWRYSTEIEVYPTVVLLSILLMSGVFSLSRSTSNLTLPVIALAVFGGLTPLVYQPMGLLSGFAVPFFLLVSFGFRWAVLYCAIAGPIVAAGTLLAVQLAAPTIDSSGAEFILDSQYVKFIPPQPIDALKMVFGFSSMVFSTNWILFFEPIQSNLQRILPGRNLDFEIYVAEKAGALAWIALVTTALGLLLVLRLVWVAIRSGSETRLCAMEGAILVWLLCHMAMIAVAGPPGTTEPWIAVFPAVFVLVTRRLIAPLINSGHMPGVLALIAVVFVHNASGGIGVLSKPEGDYVRARGDAIASIAGKDDLVVLASEHWLGDHLYHRGLRKPLIAEENEIAVIRAAVDDALRSGKDVWFDDDMASPPDHLRRRKGAFAAELETLAKEYLRDAEKHQLADTGWMFQASNGVSN